jgi:hypothetical protein
VRLVPAYPYVRAPRAYWCADQAKKFWALGRATYWKGGTLSPRDLCKKILEGVPVRMVNTSPNAS